jgi:hypothetical protein
MLLAFLILPDRVIIDPIPAEVIDRCHIHAGERLPQSEGFVMRAWEGYELTQWKWDVAVTLEPDGRIQRSLDGMMLPRLPERKIGYKLLTGLGIPEDMIPPDLDEQTKQFLGQPKKKRDRKGVA